MKKSILFLLAAVAVMAVLVAEMLFAFRSFTEQALAPITDTTHNLQTQAAKIFNPTPTILPDPVTIINEVRSIARLETIQYSALFFR